MQNPKHYELITFGVVKLYFDNRHVFIVRLVCALVSDLPIFYFPRENNFVGLHTFSTLCFEMNYCIEGAMIYMWKKVFLNANSSFSYSSHGFVQIEWI